MVQWIFGIKGNKVIGKKKIQPVRRSKPAASKVLDESTYKSSEFRRLSAEQGNCSDDRLLAEVDKRWKIQGRYFWYKNNQSSVRRNRLQNFFIHERPSCRVRMSSWARAPRWVPQRPRSPGGTEQPRAMGESMANPPRYPGDRVGMHPMPNVEHSVFQYPRVVPRRGLPTHQRLGRHLFLRTNWGIL